MINMEKHKEKKDYYKMRIDFKRIIDANIKHNKGMILKVAQIELALIDTPFSRTAILKALKPYEEVGKIRINKDKTEIEIMGD